MDIEPSMLKVLFTKEEIIETVKRLAKEITEYYAPLTDEITAVCILKGSVHFYSDLLKELDLKVRYNFVHVSSYSGTTTTGKVRVKTWVDESLTGKYVLLVEDIVDTGNTLRYIINYIWKQRPADVKLVSLLEKTVHEHGVEIDFVGQKIDDKFVIGYGLDYDEFYRNLPYIGYVPKKEG
ncbi:hypoxanthine phosphoribosyltransferase [Kosmotoga pacifica]|nr:hypoxanthine phosphoribosyltransferase [Kosmotoga pacifica]